ncbi:AbrB/MazE/SpoVT family DNA-binding domain-containing protein [Candidatus Micrarchaeota archaeon]|nr:AbrB/MazE/SpoVT family DNA-binding domain-containing protein [Candidatus Micrarchaeota archaeon]
MEIAKAKITSKRQITIPKVVSKELDLDEGDEIVFLVERKNVSLIKNPKDLMKAMDNFSEGKSFPDISHELQKSRREWK